MATFALGLRRRTRLSRTQIFHGQAKERLRILNRDIRTVVSNFFVWRLPRWKSFPSQKFAILSHFYFFFGSNRYIYSFLSKCPKGFLLFHNSERADRIAKRPILVGQLL